LLLFSASDSWSNNIVQDPNNNSYKQLAEKVYLHIDRILYNSGDNIWFKAYVIDPSTNRLSENTNNLHVELISPESNIILCRSIRIEKGTGNGDFLLSDSVPAGIYRIRAYTNHMRNYGEPFFFIKEITVINPYDDDQDMNKTVEKINKSIDISFFPEGGSLVDNVTSTVAFKAVNAFGKGCDVNVKLYSSTGELITMFDSKHLGLGFFNIKPISGYTYYTIVQGKDGGETKVPLPKSFATGVAISTFLTPDKNLILSVNTNEATLPLLLGKGLSVHISSRNLVNRTTRVMADSLINNFLIPLDSIPDGIMKVTLTGFEGLPLCERLVFIQKKDDVSLKISTNKNEYKPREKVTTEISLSGDSTFAGVGDFSLSATEERFTGNSSIYPRSIVSWFLLESDVRGIVEEPSYYFDPENKNRLQDLDLLLMTQGWRDFKWKYDSLSAFKHEIGFTISGSVNRMVNNNPIDGIKINLGLFTTNSTEFIVTKTDKNGLFKFEDMDIYGMTRAFVSSTGKFENIQGRITIDPIKYTPPEIPQFKRDTVEYELKSKDILSYRKEVLIKLNNLKKYKLHDTLLIGEVIISSEKIATPNEIKVKESRKFYSTPDKELIIPVTAENFAGDVFNYLTGRIGGIRIIRGIFPCSLLFPEDVQIYIRGQFTKDVYKCSDGSEIEYKRGALILLDGYETDEFSLISILTLSMNIIDRIDILNASPLYGVRGANGVINIITKTGIRREPVKLSPNSVYTSIQGFDIPRIFYSPKYDNKTEQTFLPDYRTTLFWEPNILIETNRKTSLQYFNADNQAKISIVVEGITEEGIPVTGKINYDVK